MADAQLPIYIIGAGGIVHAAHLPAYQLAGYRVQGIVDLVPENAISTAEKFNILEVFADVPTMLQQLPANAIIDLAVPPSAMISILEQLPLGCNVLLQKPMGETLEDAKRILQIAREKKLVAAVNFQLRYADFVQEAKKMIETGLLGTINHIEINVNVYTPWHLWDFLRTAPRVEILYHSIHYIDLMRYLLGSPTKIYAKTTQHPDMSQMAAVRSNIIMDYGNLMSANILTNHSHHYGRKHQQSYIKIEGTKGAVMIHFGALINYPVGEADIFEYVLLEEDQPPVWKEKKLEKTWFPHAFMGSMEQMMLAALGKINRPNNTVEDAIFTMACVEAAYKSSNSGGEQLDTLF
ncbi:MAG: Gfo/Idh/MocA family oxidoreductase [Chitinophagaceae bacterium]|nr:Gfo/Idh/MocA family oxidoreductase [Chitinophagaceae bacterium]